MGQHTLRDESRWKDRTQRNMAPHGYISLLDEEKDEAIYQDIIQGLYKSSLNTDDVIVTVTNANIYLRGLIDSFDDFIKIEEFITHVAGVKEIKNELQVRT